MKKPIFFHYLFCVNRLCSASIFQHVEEVRVPITSENRDANFVCSHCHRNLFSAFSNASKPDIISANAPMDGLHIYIPN